MRLLLSALILLLCLPATPQIESRLAYRRYTIQDGLPQMQTERTWQDSRGYIYIGTLSGFVRFDGKTFTPFLKGRRENIVGFVEVRDPKDADNTPGEVRALNFRRQWITDRDEVTMRPIDPQRHWLLNNFNAGSLPNGYVLLEDSLEENRRLCKVGKSDFQPVLKGALLDKMTPDRKLFVDSTGIYVPTEQGLYIVRGHGGAGVRKATGRRVSGNGHGSAKARRLTAKGDVFTLLRTPDALLALAADGIYEVRGHGGTGARKATGRRVSGNGHGGAGALGIRLKTAFRFNAPDYGLTAGILANGHLIIADSHTLYEYDGDDVHVVASGLNLVKDILVDRWDRLWVATYEGLFCFFNRYFTNHTLTDEDDIVRAVAIDGKGRLTMGTLNGKLIVDGQTVDEQEGHFYIPASVTIDGTVYIPGDGDIMRYGGPGTRGYDDQVGWLHLPHDRYQFVGKAGGRLIIGSRTCISRYDPKTGTIDTLTTEILHPWCAAEDGKGRLWVGSSSGLYADGQKKDYPQRLIISTMEADRQGSIFFASADSLFLIRDGEVEELNSQLPPLSGHEIRSLHVSPKGCLVIAAIDGLFVCRVSTDYRLTDCRFFDHTNGFTMLEPQKTVMAESDDGTVWLPGVEQMSSFKPTELLNYHEEDTYITPPLRWWEHWWVWLIGVALLALAVWAGTRWQEKRRSRRKMIKLEGEKLQKERQISAIRQKAIDADPSPLASDIVKMTEKPGNTKVTIRTANGIMVFDSADIAYFKADRNNTTVVTFDKTDVIFMGLGAVEQQLDPKIFLRADRSTLVNIHNISHLDTKERLCRFRAADGKEVETTLMTPAFKRLKDLL